MAVWTFLSAGKGGVAELLPGTWVLYHGKRIIA